MTRKEGFGCIPGRTKFMAARSLRSFEYKPLEQAHEERHRFPFYGPKVGIGVHSGGGGVPNGVEVGGAGVGIPIM